jgi:flagellar motility protein MotE (MotC chaperone)
MAAKNDAKVAQTVKEIEQAMLGPKMQDPYQEVEEEKELKPMGKPVFALLVSLVWLVALGLPILFVLGNPPLESSESLRGWLLKRLDPELEIREHLHANDILYYQELRQHLEDEWADEMADLDEREDELLMLADELDDREAELNELQAALEDMRDRLADSGIIGPDLVHAAKTLERMEPAAAAATMQEMKLDDAVRVSLVMNTKRLAPIFSAMEPEIAAAILEEMSDEDDVWDDLWDDLDFDFDF